MSEEDNAEKITNAIVSYLNFLIDFKKAKTDDITSNDQGDTFEIREYNLKCYIIDKEPFDDFRYNVNFNELVEILNPINDENINKCKLELKKCLEEDPYEPNGNNVKIFSKEEDLKEIVKNFNNYSFVNKDLLIVMGVPENKLKDNYMIMSKNKNNTSLKSINNDFILYIINEKKKDGNKIENENKIKKEENDKYNNIDSVEEIIKKIFVLLYFKDEIIQKKINKKIKDVYNMKNYYLISKVWLNEYKAFFKYDEIKDKLIKELDLENNKNNYSYKKVKYNLDSIVNKIGKIELTNKVLENKIRSGFNLIPKMRKLETKKKENKEEGDYIQETEDPEVNYDLIEIPYGFEIITEDIFELLIQEKFFFNLNDIVINKIKFKGLIGNNQIIIKSKYVEQNGDIPKYLNRYFFYIDKNKIMNDLDEFDKEDTCVIYYILDFEKDEYFFKDMENIIKNGILNYISKKGLQLNEDKINCLQDFMDDKKKKIIGKLINIRIKDYKIIKNEDIIYKGIKKKLMILMIIIELIIILRIT